MCDMYQDDSQQQHAMRHTQLIMEEKLRSMKMMQMQRQIERKMMLEERPEMEMQLARMKQQQQQQSCFSTVPQQTLDLSQGSGSMNNSRSPPFLSSQGPAAAAPLPGSEQQQQPQPIFVRAVYMPHHHHQDLMTAQGGATYAPVADFSGSSARYAQQPQGYPQFASASGLPMFASAPGPCSRQVSASPSTDEMLAQERAKQLSLRQAALQQELEDLQHQKEALLFRPRPATSYLPQQSLAMQQELAASRQHMAEMAFRQASIDQQEQEIRELAMYRKLRTQLPQPEYMSSAVHQSAHSSLGMMNQQYQGPVRLPLDQSRMLLQRSSLSTSPELSKQRQEIIQQSASLGGPQNSPEVQQLLKEAYRVLEDPSAPQQQELRAQPSPHLQAQMARLTTVPQQVQYAALPAPPVREEPPQLKMQARQESPVPLKQEPKAEKKPAPVEVKKRESIPVSVNETDNEEEEEESDHEDDCSTEDDDSEDKKQGKKKAKTVVKVKKTKNALEKKTPRKDLQWMYSYDMLKSYKEVNGDCIVPRGYAPNPPLGSWVAEQRKQFKRMKLGKNSTLTQDRIEMLEKLHFAWDAQRAAWDGHFENLVHFKEKYGHCHVSLGDTDFPKLGLWVKEQRRHYGLMHTGGQTHMNEDRIKQLEEVGFCWDTQEATWLVRFLELKRYKQRYGDCLVPEQFKENPLLGSWVLFQRRQYKRLVDGEVGHHVLTQSRINKLNAIGFCWDLEDEDTLKKRKKNAKALLKEKKRSRSNNQDNDEGSGSCYSTDNDMDEDDESKPLKQKRKLYHDLLDV